MIGNLVIAFAIGFFAGWLIMSMYKEVMAMWKSRRRK